ncbi:MAG TPA: FtsX-like permease family protein [Streptosporangiaceae bacterium]|nr:FtsX-like permease family protein [Streptosporangiaceae bacterium]
MNTMVPERAATRRSANGGVAARRAVARWAVRLLRHEWRQQLLILALITAAVAATVVGSAVATTTPSPATAAFGTAQDLATFTGPGPRIAAEIASIKHRFGTVDVIENQTFSVPGSVQTYSLRAQDPHGPFGRPMLSLISGQYPAGAGQVAVTSGVASDFHLAVGSTWTVGGATRTVTGIASNPQNLLDEFALVAPGQVTAPTLVTVLFDARGVPPADIGPTAATPQTAAARALFDPETISLAASVLGMLMIALVAAGGFTVLARRRLRSIGMLAAQGATRSGIRLVVRANGVATGAVGAAAGFALGLAAWLAYRPHVEASGHHVIGVLQLPWTVIWVSMVLAVLAAYAAAARPARAIARVPVVAALSGHPPAPKPLRHLAVPFGLGFLALAFFLLGLAGAGVGASAAGNSAAQLDQVAGGLISLVVAVVLLSPACLALLAKLGRWTPVMVRLALRDLARYRARSGPALAAISLSVLIASIVSVVGAARFGDALDWVGPNLTSSQLIVYPPGHLNPNGPPPTPSQLAATRTAAQRIATSLDDRYMVTLEASGSGLNYNGSGRGWSGTIYVATPQLLRAFGITPAQVDPGADILTMRPGLSTMAHLQLWDNPKVPPGTPCAPGCLPNPPILQIGALPSGTSAPNTVITERAMRRFGLHPATAGWLIQAPGGLTATQITDARQSAVTAGASIETVNDVPSYTQVTAAATIFGVLLALGILAMSIGLVRSETAGDLRTLTAAGAGRTARRNLTAATAGALALTGAIIGTAGGYLAAAGFFRTNQLDQLSELDSVPVAVLVWILAGMPLIAAAASWLLAGREPPAIARRPLE